MNHFRRVVGALLVATAIFHAATGVSAEPSTVAASSPFSGLTGRWVGTGRLGFREGKKVETVECRVTYFEKKPDELEQNIRCATPSGKVEIKSLITHAAGVLKGSWSELIYDLKGELSGQVTPRGFRVAVSGPDLSATMDIIVRDGKQVIEIHFHNSTLSGLTLILAKG